MLEMTVDWWQLVLRAGVVYVVVLTLLRLSGKRTIGEFSPFDVVVLLLLAEAAQGSMLGDDTSLQGGLLVIAVLVGLNWLLAFISTRSQRVEAVVEGRPVILIRDGQLDRDSLLANNVPEGDLDEVMRGHEIRQRSDVELAVLEPSGQISFFKRQAKSADQGPADASLRDESAVAAQDTDLADGAGQS
ncbi:MAG: DUF421 domain-containing protein [Xanthomonadales bacterium]|nr:DUF421 domain-containing protein [Xanthomonadales bacterium]